MKILIVEDDLLIAEMLKRMLTKLNNEVCHICSSFGETQTYLKTNPSIDLVFLDINLNQPESGIDIGKELKLKFNIPFIYLTSYSDTQTIQAASKTLPENYLLKPFNETTLLSALAIVEQKLEAKEKNIVIKDGTEKIKVFVDEIEFIKSEGNYVEIHTPHKRFVVRNSIENILKETENNYIVRTHRSFAVNMKYVLKIKNQFIFINQNQIPLSRKYKDEVSVLFNQLN